MTCEGKTTATVEFPFVDGERLKVISKNPGVNVTLTPTIQGQAVIHVTGTAYAAGCVILNNYDEIYGTANDNTPLTLNAVNDNYCPGGAFYKIPGVSDGYGTLWLAGTVRLVKQPIDGVQVAGCHIAVTDSTGQIFDKSINQACPTYKIACDGNCPEGFCKCEIPEYPGYCCLDCASIAASVRSITNELRAKNG